MGPKRSDSTQISYKPDPFMWSPMHFMNLWQYVNLPILGILNPYTLVQTTSNPSFSNMCIHRWTTVFRVSKSCAGARINGIYPIVVKSGSHLLKAWLKADHVCDIPYHFWLFEKPYVCCCSNSCIFFVIFCCIECFYFHIFTEQWNRFTLWNICWYSHI